MPTKVRAAMVAAFGAAGMKVDRLDRADQDRRARTCCQVEPRMKFISTRGQSPAVSFGQPHLTQGLAPDGGLYMPETWPSFRSRPSMARATLPEVAEVMLAAVRRRRCARARDRRRRARCLQFSGAARAGRA